MTRMARAKIPASELTMLADLLDRDDDLFEFVASTYLEARDNGGGLQDVIERLREEARS